MPVNRNALIRFRTIDNCLRNRQRTWTLNDLIEHCSEALYEYEGIEKGVSRRTIQSDIQLMRSDKLGYNAPIVVKDKKYYFYSDSEYTITNIPLTEQDMSTLNEVVNILKQFKGFSHFEDMDGMIKRLEDKVYTSKKQSRPIIDFERNEGLKGLHHLDELYQSILNKRPLLMTYQSFRARNPGQFIFHPQFLKEYNNRWFVMGVKTKDSFLFNFALDRIVALESAEPEEYIHINVNPVEHFENVVGVTVNRNMRPRIVRLFIDRAHAPYVLTKPIHPSQKLEKRIKDGVIITLEVQLNFELESKILGFGESMKVLAPDNLVQRISRKLRVAVKNYDNKSFPQEVDF